MSLIDQYIESLTAHLRRNVSQSKDQVAEIRTHLELDLRDRVDAGATQADAELAACKAMGSPQIVANQIIRQTRAYATGSAWRLALPCGLFLAFAMVIPYSLLGNNQYQETADTLVRWAPFFALLFFGWRVATTRRWLVKPMAAWAALATVGVLVGNTITISQNAPPAQVGQFKEFIRKDLEQVQVEQGFVDKWKNGSPQLDKAPFMGAVSSSFVVPFVPFAIGGTEQGLSLEPASAAEARARWNKYGAMYAAGIQERKRFLEASLTGPPRLPLSNREVFLNMLKIWTMFTCYQVVVFFIVNTGVLAFLRAREKRKSGREPMFA